MSTSHAIEIAERSTNSPFRLWLAGVLFAGCCATGVVAGYYFGITRSLGLLAIILVACGFAAFGGLVADWLAELLARSPLRDLAQASASKVEEMETEVGRLRTAFNAVDQGISVFGPDRRLILSNRRYAEMHGIPLELVRPGLTPAEVLQHCIAAAGARAAGAAELARRAAAIAEAGVAAETLVELPNGRVILFAHAPLAGGGWVATHHDLTDLQAAPRKAVA